jgi:hypothetical protein
MDELDSAFSPPWRCTWISLPPYGVSARADFQGVAERGRQHIVSGFDVDQQLTKLFIIYSSLAGS